MNPLLIYTSELSPILREANMPWDHFTPLEKLAAVKTVLFRRQSPAALARLRLINLGVPLARAFRVINDNHAQT